MFLFEFFRRQGQWNTWNTRCVVLVWILQTSGSVKHPEHPLCCSSLNSSNIRVSEIPETPAALFLFEFFKHQGQWNTWNTRCVVLVWILQTSGSVKHLEHPVCCSSWILQTSGSVKHLEHPLCCANLCLLCPIFFYDGSL